MSHCQIINIKHKNFAGSWRATHTHTHTHTRTHTRTHTHTRMRASTHTHTHIYYLIYTHTLSVSPSLVYLHGGPPQQRMMMHLIPKCTALTHSFWKSQPLCLLQGRQSRNLLQTAQSDLMLEFLQMSPFKMYGNIMHIVW